VDRSAAGGVERQVEPLDQRADAQIPGLGRHDDQRVGAIVDQDLRRGGGVAAVGADAAGRRAAALAAHRRAAAAAAGLPDAEDLLQLGLELLGVGVLDQDRVDALVGARLVELLAERDHVADLAGVVGHQDDVADLVDRAVLALEHGQRVRHRVGGHVARPEDEPDDLVGVARRPLHHGDGLALGLAGLDDAQGVALGHDGHAHRRQRDQEHPIGVLGRHLVGRHHRDLLGPLHDPGLVDERLAGERRDPDQEVLELGLRLERDRDQATLDLLAAVQALVVGGVGRGARRRRRGLGGRRGDAKDHPARGGGDEDGELSCLHREFHLIV
jgi:hypothetical protein